MFDRFFGNRQRVTHIERYAFIFVDSNALTAPARRHPHGHTWQSLVEDITLTARYNVLLSHVPLYRHSEEMCGDCDANCPLLERFSLSSDPSRTQCDEYVNGTFHHVNVPDSEVLNEQVSQDLLRTFHPHLIISGHLHYSCRHTHTIHKSRDVSPVHSDSTPMTSHTEITVPTFNWRNRVDPSYVVLDLDEAGGVWMRRCPLPCEGAVFGVYFVGGALVGAAVLTWLRRCLFAPAKKDV